MIFSVNFLDESLEDNICIAYCGQTSLTLNHHEIHSYALMLYRNFVENQFYLYMSSHPVLRHLKDRAEIEYVGVVYSKFNDKDIFNFSILFTAHRFPMNSFTCQLSDFDDSVPRISKCNGDRFEMEVLTNVSRSHSHNKYSEVF